MFGRPSIESGSHEINKVSCKCKPHRIPSTEPTPEVEVRCKHLLLSNHQLDEVMKRFLEEVYLGLGKRTHDKATVKCFPTYVQDIPDGTERGKYLGLEVNEPIFRILMVELHEDYSETTCKEYNIPQHIMLGTGEQFFDHIAARLGNFVRDGSVYKEPVPLGFTFGFMVEQKGLTKGIMREWSKGFNCTGVIGNDVVQLLKDAIERKGIASIDVYAILNDTTGTLMACAWKYKKCRMAIIVAYGTNACYIEKQSNVETYDEEDHGTGNVIVNLEWGSFGNNGCLDFIKTEYDIDVDENSINPGKQIFEKMVSGMYLGELVRLAIEQLTKEGLLFEGKGSELLFTKGRFPTEYICEIEADRQGEHTTCKRILEGLEVKRVTRQDCLNVRYICECMSRRSAYLVSALTATILDKMEEPEVTIGVSGFVYKSHPHYHSLMLQKIAQLIDSEVKFELVLTEDGGGKGAALVAAVACKTRLPKE